MTPPQPQPLPAHWKSPFDHHHTRVRPIPGWGRGAELTFPSGIDLCRARGGEHHRKLAFLIHGWTQNEDYFCLVAPRLVQRGFDTWALRLPGYVSTNEKPGFWPNSLGISLSWYGWVAASALAHLQAELACPPAQTLAWGHSMGGAILSNALADLAAAKQNAGVQLAVLEAPAFAESISVLGPMITPVTLMPDDLLNRVTRTLLIDDCDASETTRFLLANIVPGRCSRAIFNLNLLAILNPLNRFPKLTDSLASRLRFVIGRYDRLVEGARLQALAEKIGVPPNHILELPRNHFLALSSAPEICSWLDAWMPDAQLPPHPGPTPSLPAL